MRRRTNWRMRRWMIRRKASRGARGLFDASRSLVGYLLGRLSEAPWGVLGASLRSQGPLGAYWVPLWGPLGALGGRLGEFLGASWRHLGGLSGPLGRLFGQSGGPRGWPPGPSWSHLGGPPGALLGPPLQNIWRGLFICSTARRLLRFLGPQGMSWAPSGPLGPSWCPLGARRAPSWSPRGGACEAAVSDALPRGVVGRLGPPPIACLMASWAFLGPSWGLFGPSPGSLGAILAPSTGPRGRASEAAVSDALPRGWVQGFLGLPRRAGGAPRDTPQWRCRRRGLPPGRERRRFSEKSPGGYRSGGVRLQGRRPCGRTPPSVTTIHWVYTIQLPAARPAAVPAQHFRRRLCEGAQWAITHDTSGPLTALMGPLGPIEGFAGPRASVLGAPRRFIGVLLSA